MRNIFIFLILLACLGEGISQETRDTNNLTFRFSGGYSFANYFGDNVYNNYHSSFRGPNIKLGFILFDKVNLDMRLGYASADIKDKSIIYNSETLFKSFTFSLGGVVHPLPSTNLSLFAFYAKEKGVNQGSFKGQGFGTGLDFEVIFADLVYVVLGTEYRRSYFDIQAPVDIEYQFAKANSIYFHVGLGFRIY